MPALAIDLLINTLFICAGVLHEKKTSSELGKLIAELHATDQADLNEWEKVREKF